jgi:predicted DNA-binding transcriptional regulator AlpA
MASPSIHAAPGEIGSGGADDRGFDNKEASLGKSLNVGIARTTRHIRAEFQMNGTACATATIPETDNYISVREVARRSSMSEKSIRNFIRNDALPHYRNSRSGKIWLRWIEFVAWMERRRIELKQDDSLLGILRDMNGAGGAR